MNIPQLTTIAGMTLAGIVASSSVAPVRALTFNFIPEAGTSQQAIEGFNAAGALWSSRLSDNVSVNINIGFKPLAAGILGESSSTTQNYNYSQVYTALGRDRTSADDNSAFNYLSNGSNFNVLINRTANNPNGYGSATPYLDNNGNDNNRSISMTSANAKALGLTGNGGTDANLTFSTAFTWDFDRRDGISNGAFDFVGTAAHEIGHALGFLSGVDILDENSTNGNAYNDSVFTYVSPLDLFRYSSDSKNIDAIDWTADNRPKYLSADGGNTKIADLSTGVNFGDGSQASHWLDRADLGILSPKLMGGNILQISNNDLRALDLIGWNLGVNNNLNSHSNLSIAGINSLDRMSAMAGATSVPEPPMGIGTLLGAILGAGTIFQLRRRYLVTNEFTVTARRK